MERGTFIDHEGRPAVRFQRTYPHPVERVWTAVTESEELAHWFPSHVRLEPRVGGRIEFSGDPNLKASSGTVLAYEPPHRLAFTWFADELHIELAPAGDGGCTLTLINVLEARDTAARNAAGWTVCLAALGTRLSGGVPHGPHSGSSAPWKAHYDAYIAAGVPSGAPVPGAADE